MKKLHWHKRDQSGFIIHLCGGDPPADLSSLALDIAQITCKRCQRIKFNSTDRTFERARRLIAESMEVEYFVSPNYPFTTAHTKKR
jgi:hypothetical protein